MAGGKETPRQKMIGMMYLVLTALLAMNAPKELINSFVVVNEGLVKSNAGFESKNSLTLKSFEKSAAEDEAYQKGFQTAKSIKAKSSALYKHIEELKRYLMIRTSKSSFEVPEGLSTENQSELTKFLMETPGSDTTYLLKKVLVKDNYDVPTFEMIGSDMANPRPETDYYSALNLKKKIQEFKDVALKDFDKGKNAALFNTMEKAFSFEDVVDHGKTMPWEVGTFYHLPLAAVITNLSRMQLDVLNIEADALNELMKDIAGQRFQVDELQARVLPNTNYVMMGDSFKADIFVSASSSAIVPEVYLTKDKGMIEQINKNVEGVDESKLEKIASSANGGIVTYGLKSSSEGDFEWGGIVKVKKPDGSGYDKYPIAPQKYTVAKGNLTISPTAMNVFYRGLPNPVKIAAPGVASNKLSLKCSNAISVTPKNKSMGEWIVKPGKGKKCECTLIGEVNGKSKKFGPAGFRVKNVPKPEAKFAGIKASGSTSLSKVKAAAGVIADMGDFDFAGAKFKVVSFTVSTIYKGQPVEKKVKGNRVTSDAKKLIGSLKKGSKLYIEDVKAKGPSGMVTLGGIKIKIL